MARWEIGVTTPLRGIVRVKLFDNAETGSESADVLLARRVSESAVRVLATARVSTKSVTLLILNVPLLSGVPETAMTWPGIKPSVTQLPLARVIVSPVD